MKRIAGAPDLTPTPAAVDDYRLGRTAFVDGLLPSTAVRMGVRETIDLLRSRYGTVIDLALEAGPIPIPDLSVQTAVRLRSPVAGLPDGTWLRRANIVGVNVRTIADAWSVVPYTLTLPAVQSAVHLLPFLEPGVASSLYGPASWEVDPSMLSVELAELEPRLDTVGSQLRAVVHLLHVTGRTVGMDVLPHSDRFSEFALAQPDLFEWMERREDRIVRHGAVVTTLVESLVHGWLAREGAADGSAVPGTTGAFFGLAEDKRLAQLFGLPGDSAGRLRRRISLIRGLHQAGIETVPATMGRPYRGIEVDPSPAARVEDALGMTWRDFRITEPTEMSRVFGPLARYHLYEAVGDDSWAIDPERPRAHVWEYVLRHYSALQGRFGFDFMRGDMAHVQMRPAGVARHVDARYDVLGAIAARVRTDGAPWFAYLAESFLAGPGFMAYGDESDHLEASGADAALGDLQSVAVDDPVFLPRLRWYRDLLETRSFAPSFTMMTADKDDPRFDGCYRSGSDLRLFLGLFLADMPSYMSLGFEQRDIHAESAPNEHYTKLYVFRLESGPKATHGPYVFGENHALFESLGRIRRAADELRDELRAAELTWLRPPDSTSASRLLAWRLDGVSTLVCIANLDPRRPAPAFALPSRSLAEPASWSMLLATARPAEPSVPTWNGRQWIVDGLGSGEGRVYRFTADPDRGRDVRACRVR